jgi:hypothetical protein
VLSYLCQVGLDAITFRPVCLLSFCYGRDCPPPQQRKRAAADVSACG